MFRDIYFISNVVNWIANLLALTVAILYCYRSFNPAYLRVFPVYLFVSIGIEALVNPYVSKLFDFRPFASHQLYIMNISYNIFTLFELFIFSYFLFQVVRSLRIKKIIIVLMCLFSVFFIQYPLLEGLGAFSNMAVALESIIIIIPCLTYFRELFTRTEPVDLWREPSFWLVTGIFFYLATIFPLYMTRSYLLAHGLIAVSKSLSSINNFALSITYLLFIRSYTCRIKKS
jgi:hypothetical protein